MFDKTMLPQQVGIQGAHPLDALTSPIDRRQAMTDWRALRPDQFQFDPSLGTDMRAQRMDWRSALMDWRNQRPGGHQNPVQTIPTAPPPAMSAPVNYQLPLNPYGLG